MLRIIAIFLSGILIGCFVVCIDAALDSLAGNSNLLNFGILSNLLFMYFLSLPVAIMFGFVPASITGLSYWFALKKFTQVNPDKKHRLLIGGSIGFLVTIMLSVVNKLNQAQSDVLGLISWLLCLERSRRRPALFWSLIRYIKRPSREGW